MLVHQKKVIMNMLKHGQIEDKEAAEMKDEIDDKIYTLQLTEPEIKFMSHQQRIIHLSELTNIFSEQEIEDALEEAQRVSKKNIMQESLYNPKDHVVMRGEHYDSIMYVARGVIIEKNGEYMDNTVDSMRIGRGRIACL